MGVLSSYPQNQEMCNEILECWGSPFSAPFNFHREPNSGSGTTQPHRGAGRKSPELLGLSSQRSARKGLDYATPAENEPFVLLKPHQWRVPHYNRRYVAAHGTHRRPVVPDYASRRNRCYRRHGRRRCTCLCRKSALRVPEHLLHRPQRNQDVAKRTKPSLCEGLLFSALTKPSPLVC